MNAFFEKYLFWFKCWGIVWGILATIFSFYMVTFFLGNHDWQYIRYDMPLSTGIWEARITQFVPPWFLSLGRLLPIWNALLGFMFLSGASVLLAWWYEVKEKYPCVILFSLLIVLHPYIASQLYYSYLFLSFGCWHLLIVLGVVLLWQFSLSHKVGYFVGSLFCILLGLLGYAACIELLVTIVLGKFLLDILSQKKFCRSLVMQYAIVVVSVLFIVSAFAIAMEFCYYFNLINKNMYNTQSLPVLEILLKILRNLDKPFEVLNALIPYTKKIVNVCIWGLCGLALWNIFLFPRILLIRKILAVFGLLLLFFVIILAAYISPYNTYFMWRTHAYSLPYFVAILLALVFSSRYYLIKNFSFILGVTLTFYFVSADFFVQKVWFLGNNQDDKAVERIKSELLPKLEKDKHYRLSTLGNLYGWKKFAGVKFVSVDEMETYREYWGAPHFINIFFSSGFFAYESDNPIWGDAVYLGEGFYGTANESITKRDKISSRLFADHFGQDCQQSISSIYRLKSFPRDPYFLVKQKDVFLMLSYDSLVKNILVKNINDD